MGLVPIVYSMLCYSSSRKGSGLMPRNLSKPKKGGAVCQEDGGWRDVQCGGPRAGPHAESLAGEGAGGSDDALQNQLQDTTGKRAGTQREGEFKWKMK